MLFAAEQLWHWSPGLNQIVLAVILGGGLICALISAITSRSGVGIANRSLLLILRLSSLVLIGVVLAGPEAILSTNTLRKPELVILVDRSRSMAITDADPSDPKRTRAEQLRRIWLTKGSMEKLSAAADVRVEGFDKSVRALSVEDARHEPAGDESKIAETVAQTLTESAVAVGAPRTVLLLSDGADTQAPGERAAVMVRARGTTTRLFASCTGSTAQAPNISLTVAADSPTVFDGERLTFRATVRAHGTGLVGSNATLRVERGAANGGTLLVERSITLSDAEEFKLEVPARRDPKGNPETPQQADFIARIEPRLGESTHVDNAAHAFVQILGVPIRVCVIECEPYWDTTFLLRTLRDDPRIALTKVQSSRIPVAASTLTQEWLNAFDVVVLGKGIEQLFPGDEAGKLVRFATDRGGALVYLRADPVSGSSPAAARARELLSAIAPVEWGHAVLKGGKLKVTDAARQTGVLQLGGDATETSVDRLTSGLPGMISLAGVESERALAMVWLRRDGTSGGHNDEQEPTAIAVGPAAGGKGSGGHVLAVLSDGLWRWAFLPREPGEARNVYAEFWSRTIRWLALSGEIPPGSPLALTLDRTQVLPGETVNVSIRTRGVTGVAPSLRLSHPTGRIETIACEVSSADASRFTASIATSPADRGVFTVVAELADTENPPAIRQEARFISADDRAEAIDTAARPDELRRQCEMAAPGGRLLACDESGVEELLRELVSETTAQKAPDRSEPLWDRWWVFALLGSLLCAEWLLRRRVGLP